MCVRACACARGKLAATRPLTDETDGREGRRRSRAPSVRRRELDPVVASQLQPPPLAVDAPAEPALQAARAAKPAAAKRAAGAKPKDVGGGSGGLGGGGFGGVKAGSRGAKGSGKSKKKKR